MALRSPVGERMDWQSRNEQGLPQVQEGALELDPTDARGARGSASGGPNSIERIRGSTFRNFIPPLKQQQIATEFMQSRGIPLNAQNRQQVMQFLMGADAAPAAAAPSVAADISAGIDAADAGGGMPGRAPASLDGPPMSRPDSEVAAQDPGWPNPLWLLVPAVGRRIVDAQKTGTPPSPDMVPPDGTPLRASDTVAPLMLENQPLPPDTQIRINNSGFEANVDGQWVTVDEPDDAVVQQIIQEQYGDTNLADRQTGRSMVINAEAPAQPAMPAPSGDLANMPIATEDVIPPSIRMPQEPATDASPSVEIGTDARAAASRERTKANRKPKGNEPKTKAGARVIKAIRGRS